MNNKKIWLHPLLGEHHDEADEQRPLAGQLDKGRFREENCEHTNITNNITIITDALIIRLSSSRKCLDLLETSWTPKEQTAKDGSCWTRTMMRCVLMFGSFFDLIFVIWNSCRRELMPFGKVSNNLVWRLYWPGCFNQRKILWVLAVFEDNLEIGKTVLAKVVKLWDY